MHIFMESDSIGFCDSLPEFVRTVIPANQSEASQLCLLALSRSKQVIIQRDGEWDHGESDPHRDSHP